MIDQVHPERPVAPALVLLCATGGGGAASRAEIPQLDRQAWLLLRLVDEQRHSRGLSCSLAQFLTTVRTREARAKARHVCDELGAVLPSELADVVADAGAGVYVRVGVMRSDGPCRQRGVQRRHSQAQQVAPVLRGELTSGTISEGTHKVKIFLGHRPVSLSRAHGVNERHEVARALQQLLRSASAGLVQARQTRDELALDGIVVVGESDSGSVRGRG